MDKSKNSLITNDSDIFNNNPSCLTLNGQEEFIKGIYELIFAAKFQSIIPNKRYKNKKTFILKILNAQLNPKFQKRKKFIIYNPINILLIILVFISLFPVNLSLSRYILIKLCDSNQIAITIKGKGVQKIVSKSIPGCNNYAGDLPDRIYVEGTYKTSKAYSVTLTADESDLILEWNSKHHANLCFIAQMLQKLIFQNSIFQKE